VGPYEIQSAIGSGGMGEVYRAKDIRLGRDVAVKVLPKEFANHSERMQRFEREARSASALNHPAIITIYDVGFSGSDAYIAMEYIDGKNLAELLSAGRLPLKKIIALASQFADALAKAHEAGIVHRDLKPENLMITSDGYLKILDFGLAKLTNPSMDVSGLQTQTSAGMVLGTASFMSPEQAAGRAVDFRSDQFSFGSILYEMVTGRRAFSKNTAAETMAAIIRNEAEPVSSIVPNLPGPIRWIIERCMSKNPDERYASTRDLAHDLQSLRDHFSEITSSESNPSLQGIKPQSRLLLALAILTSLIAGAAVTYWFHRTPEQNPAVFRTLTYSGTDSSPTVSSNGQLVAFRSDRDGTPRIWLKQLKGGNEVAVTTGPDDLPRFSPDGSLLLFIRNEGTSASLFRVPVLGGEERKIIEDVRSADWSPDGNKIAFIRWKAAQGNPDSQFFVVSPDGSNLQQLAEIKERQLQSVRWSPDGHYLVATVIIQGNYGSRDAIALIDVQNKKTRWILSSYSWPTSAVWTGTKNQIAYFSPETGVALFQLRGDSTLYLHDVETGERKPVFWAQSAGEIMDIAGKGRIVMHSASLRENLREITLNGKKDSGTSSWLTRGNSCNRQPVYSPDGKHILFSSNMAANLDLWEVSTESRALRRITEDSAGDWDPNYSPDGKHILWSSNRNGHFEIWIANEDGSGARQVTKDGVDAENPAMTLDGKWIVYNSYNPDLKIRGIWKIHPDGTGAIRIAAGLTQWPEVSPDGRYASYGFYKQSLNDPITYERVVEIETGKEIPFEIKVSNRDRVGGRMRWMPDGKSIVFVDEDEKGNWRLFAQDFMPGKDTADSRRSIAGFDADRKIDTFTISPDSTQIVMAEVEVLSSLIMAEGIPGIEPQHK
jgi:eukaryotic-like serine/threonine-protein kinase